MSDSKEYITKVHENGSVNISEDVVASIAALAILEVEGVCGLTGNLSAAQAETISKKGLTKGIRVSMSDEAICLDCCIVLSYGYPVLETATAVQDKVTATIEGMTGVSVKTVNVSVCGVSLAK